MAGSRHAVPVWFLPVFAWMGVIFALSSRQRFPGPGGLWDDVLAVLAHLFLFGTLAILMLIAVSRLGPVTWRTAIGVVVAVMVYGVSDEIHQSFVPGRSASVFDVVVDTTGASLIAFVWLVLARSRCRLSAS